MQTEESHLEKCLYHVYKDLALACFIYNNIGYFRFFFLKIMYLLLFPWLRIPGM